MSEYRNIVDTRFGYHYDRLKLARYSGNPDFPAPEEATSGEDQAMIHDNGVAGQVGPQTAYAVVAAGIITPESDIVTLTTHDGSKCPVIIAVFDDKQKAEAYKGRMQAKVRRILGFTRDDVEKATPIYGVQEVSIKGKKPRKPMSEEEKRRRAEAMQAGRKRVRKTNPAAH